MSSGPGSAAQVFRLPKTAYLMLLFLFVGAWPTALYGGQSGGFSSPAKVGPLIFLFLIPVVAAVFIRRTATKIDEQGITVHALFGTRKLPWEQVRGLSVEGATVYAVLADGAVRLPCVRHADLGAVARASGGRLPDIGDPAPKYAPARRRGR
ncbi:MAG TPA: PH domain-containing protein [Jatrophihabitans sp.]|nr:PH domain-containing protein [Jatrophihabitans sp.]